MPMRQLIETVSKTVVPATTKQVVVEVMAEDPSIQTEDDNGLPIVDKEGNGVTADVDVSWICPRGANL